MQPTSRRLAQNRRAYGALARLTGSPPSSRAAAALSVRRGRGYGGRLIGSSRRIALEDYRYLHATPPRGVLRAWGGPRGPARRSVPRGGVVHRPTPSGGDSSGAWTTFPGRSMRSRRSGGTRAEGAIRNGPKRPCRTRRACGDDRERISSARASRTAVIASWACRATLAFRVVCEMPSALALAAALAKTGPEHVRARAHLPAVPALPHAAEAVRRSTGTPCRRSAAPHALPRASRRPTGRRREAPCSRRRSDHAGQRGSRQPDARAVSFGPVNEGYTKRVSRRSARSAGSAGSQQRGKPLPR